MENTGNGGIRDCELCGDGADLYCSSDSAFLCCKCDARVHEVNFLVARHVRKPICRSCKHFFAGSFVTGAGFDDVDSFHPALCNSCSPDFCSDADSVSSSSSSCISTTVSAGKKMMTTTNRKMRNTRANKSTTRADSKLGAVIASWCRRIGVADDEMVRIASRIFTLAMGNAAAAAKRNTATVRLWLAASVWLTLRLGKAASFEAVRRLEIVSGVKEKAVVGVAARIAGLVRDRRTSRRLEEEEGFGESC